MGDLEFREALEKLVQDPDRKHAYFDLCELYSQVDAKQREFLHSDWMLKQIWSIPRSRAILLTDSYPSGQRLRARLIGLSLLPSRDYRDDLMVICPLYHSAIHLGIDPRLLFEEIAVFSQESSAHLLRQFCQRSPRDQALEAFGYKEELTPDGVYFDDIQQKSLEETLHWMEATIRRPLTDEEREVIVASRRKNERYYKHQPKK